MSSNNQSATSSSKDSLQYQHQQHQSTINGQNTNNTSNNQQFSIFRSAFDPIASSIIVGTGPCDLNLQHQNHPHAEIDRSHSLLSDSSFALFKSDRLRRKKNLKKANKTIKRNSLQVFDTADFHSNYLNNLNDNNIGGGGGNTNVASVSLSSSSNSNHHHHNSVSGDTSNSTATQHNIMTTVSSGASVVPPPVMDNHSHQSHHVHHQQRAAPTLPPTAEPVKRNVIIQRDSRGYGIRISGDNPVSIESVHHEGAAYKAGVRNGDRIIKVNGTLVTKLSHADVVRMIQNCGSFVGLTLLSNPQASSTSSLQGVTVGESTSPLATSPTPALQQQHSTSSISSPHLIINNNNLLGVQVPGGPTSPAATSPTPFNNHVSPPQPVAESTQQAYQNNLIKTYQMMIDREKLHLNTNKLNESERVDVSRRIEEIKRKLAEVLSVQNNNSSETLPLRSQIITVDSDYEDNVSPGLGLSGIGQDVSDFVLPVPDPSTEDTLNNNSHTSKSPPSKGTSFLSKIPGKSSSAVSKRDSKYFNQIAAAGGILAAPLLPGLGISSATVATTPVPISLDNLHLHSLRFARYLINSQLPPHAMLFYVVTKHIFPMAVANATNTVVNVGRLASSETTGLRQLITRWGYSILATWAVKDSPLFFIEFTQEMLIAFDKDLESFTRTISSTTNATAQAANPFEPFLAKAKDIVQKQLEQFQGAVQGKPDLLTSQAKADLQATVEMLLLGSVGSAPGSAAPKLDLRDVDPTFDQFIALAQVGSVFTMAIITSLLTVGHYVFGIASKHLLLTDAQNCMNLLLSSTGNSGIAGSTPSSAPIATSQSTNSATTLNPVLKLSVESSVSSKKANHKRNVSLPAQSRPVLPNGVSTGGSDISGTVTHLPPGGISEGGHYFVAFNEMTKVEFCSGCYHSLWGDLNNYRCARCLMFVHSWCLKTCVAVNSCENLDQSTHTTSAVSGPNISSGVQLRTTSTREPSRKKSRIKSNKKTSVIEKLTERMTVNFQRPNLADVSNLHRSFSSLSSSSYDYSSSSSSDFDEDFSVAATVGPAMGVQVDEEAQHLTGVAGDNRKSSSTLASSLPGAGGLTAANSCLGPRAPLPVNRSGSFNQRKKTKSSASGSTPRKRSDPALTSRHMSTITGVIGSIDSPTPPVLASAQSSGALLNYTTVAIDPVTGHQLQHQTSTGSATSGGNNRTASTAASFRPLSKGQMKNMTASDSSLMSATTTIGSSGLSTNQSSINLSNNTSASNTSSPRNNRRGRRKKTADSAIHGCSGSESETDDTAPLTIIDKTAEDLGYDNESIQPISSIDDLNSTTGTTPPKTAVPPPLPPRPPSSKRLSIKQEIVESEMNHYETLRYIRKIYQRPLRKERNIFTGEQMDSIFGNTKQLKSVHKKICKELRAAHCAGHDPHADSLESASLEKSLMEIFTGDLGISLEREASLFCVNQKLGGGMEVWNQKRKDSRLKALFDNELKSREMPDCRWARLSLQDLMGSVFQRPLRYPLLLDRLLHSTPSDTMAYKHLELALTRSRRIVECVNESTKRAENKARLEEIIKKTEQSIGSKELMSQLTTQELIHEGPLVWRHTKAKVADVLLILTNQMLLVLSRDSSGDRYSLKKHTNPTTKLPYKLDIRMDDLLTRDVATDPTAFFLVSKNQDVFYEFAATTQQECKQWKDAITGAINEYRERNPNLVNAAVASSKSLNRLQDLAASKAAVAGGGVPPLPPPEPPLTPLSHSNSSGNLQSPPPSLLNRPLPKLPTEEPPPTLPPPPPPPPPTTAVAATNPPKFAGTIQNITDHVMECDLVQFNQVKVNESRVHYATPPSAGGGNSGTIDPDQVFNDRWQNIGIYVDRLKSELSELMVLCDIENHDDSAILPLKGKLVSDLLELAIKIDNNNRPTRQPFTKLVSRSQSFIRSINDENNLSTVEVKEEEFGFDPVHHHQLTSKSSSFSTTFAPAPPLPPRYEDLVRGVPAQEDDQEGNDGDDEDDLDQKSSKSQDGDGSQKSSQECLQIIEDFADLQITEFQQNSIPDTITNSKNDDTMISPLQEAGSITMTSAQIETSSASYSTTVVTSYEVVSNATKLVASSLQQVTNPFQQHAEGSEGIALNSEATGSSTSTVTLSEKIVNPFSHGSELDHLINQRSSVAHAQTISTSSTVVTSSSSTTIISTDLYEVSQQLDGSTFASPFDEMILSGDGTDLSAFDQDSRLESTTNETNVPKSFSSTTTTNDFDVISPQEHSSTSTSEPTPTVHTTTKTSETFTL